LDQWSLLGDVFLDFTILSELEIGLQYHLRQLYLQKPLALESVKSTKTAVNKHSK
jgi:hypothetical protein